MRPLTARRSALGGALVCALTALAAPSHAAPRLGASLPPFVLEDITGRAHGTAELRGRPTLLLAITASAADEAMRAWGVEADRRLAPTVRRVQIVSLTVPFVVPTEALRAIARGRAPERSWRGTWLDRDGSIRAPLGIEESEQPWALAIDAAGRVAAVAHGGPDAPDAQAIWEVLR